MARNANVSTPIGLRNFTTAAQSKMAQSIANGSCLAGTTSYKNIKKTVFLPFGKSALLNGDTRYQLFVL